jgi:hypothetical protein
MSCKQGEEETTLAIFALGNLIMAIASSYQIFGIDGYVACKMWYLRIPHFSVDVRWRGAAAAEAMVVQCWCWTCAGKFIHRSTFCKHGRMSQPAPVFMDQEQVHHIHVHARPRARMCARSLLHICAHGTKYVYMLTNMYTADYKDYVMCTADFAWGCMCTMQRIMPPERRYLKSGLKTNIKPATHIDFSYIWYIYAGMSYIYVLNILTKIHICRHICNICRHRVVICRHICNICAHTDFVCLHALHMYVGM